jgi:Fe-S-cluster containining protein
VLVTLPEFARILERVRTWPADQIAALRTRLDGHILAQSSNVAPPARRPPCALLVDGGCSVYDARPLVCRGQHAYDVRECQTHCETGAGETTHLTVVIDAVHGAMSGIATAFHDMGVGAALLDLSRALSIALDDPKVLARGTSGLSTLAGATIACPDSR